MSVNGVDLFGATGCGLDRLVVGRDGVCVAVLDPPALPRATCFDTKMGASAEGAGQLASWIDRLPHGAIAMVVSCSRLAWAHSREQVRSRSAPGPAASAPASPMDHICISSFGQVATALQQLGASTPPDRLDDAFALIGTKGGEVPLAEARTQCCANPDPVCLTCNDALAAASTYVSCHGKAALTDSVLGASADGLNVYTSNVDSEAYSAAVGGVSSAQSLAQTAVAAGPTSAVGALAALQAADVDKLDAACEGSVLATKYGDRLGSHLATDGDPSTYWVAVGAPDAVLTLDLGSERRVANLTFEWEAPAHSVLALYSGEQAGSEWRMGGAVQGAPAGGPSTLALSDGGASAGGGVSARYLRLYLAEPSVYVLSSDGAACDEAAETSAYSEISQGVYYQQDSSCSNDANCLWRRSSGYSQGQCGRACTNEAGCGCFALWSNGDCRLYAKCTASFAATPGNTNVVAFAHAAGGCAPPPPPSPPLIDCLKTFKGAEYEGTISTTVTGRICQVWSLDTPHSHSYNDVGDHNYCRNRDGENRPWCYTTDPDVTWEFCYVPYCNEINPDGTPTPAHGCYVSEDGQEYNGTASETEDHKTCQNWSLDTPQSHGFNGVGDHNHCRNPNGDEPRPWCYTTDPNDRWDYCYLPRCGTTLDFLGGTEVAIGAGDDARGVEILSAKTSGGWKSNEAGTSSYTIGRLPGATYTAEEANWVACVLDSRYTRGIVIRVTQARGAFTAQVVQARYKEQLLTDCVADYAALTVVAPTPSSATANGYAAEAVAFYFGQAPVMPPAPPTLSPAAPPPPGLPLFALRELKATSCALPEAVVTIPGQLGYRNSLTPTVTDISPRRGSTAGGTLVTLTVDSLPAGIGATDATVTIVGLSCVVQSVSPSEGKVTCLTASHGVTSATNPGVGPVSLTLASDGGTAAATANATYEYVDLWSRYTTWGGRVVDGKLNTIPGVETTGDSIWIQVGQRLLLDCDVRVYMLIVQGTLEFDRKDIKLDANYIFVMGGAFIVGTEAEPFEQQALITLHGSPVSQEIPVYGAKSLSCRFCTLELHGKPVIDDRTHVKLNQTAQKGATELWLKEPVGWPVQSRIMLTSTAANGTMEEFDTGVVTAVTDGGYRLELQWGVLYQHLGETLHLAGEHKVDFRGDVALLSHNVIIQGDGMSELDRHGVHIMLHSRRHASIVDRSKGESLSARIENVEVRYAGQMGRLGRYPGMSHMVLVAIAALLLMSWLLMCRPVHFHMIGSVRNSYVRACSIHHTFNRAIAIHGVHFLRVQNNVAFENRGHAYFVEDGLETMNIITGNLGANTRPLFNGLSTDTTPATFWYVNGDNVVEKNIAAGSSHYGELSCPLLIPTCEP
jgi:hypothetical protein